MYEQRTKKNNSNENNTGSLNHLNYESERSGGSNGSNNTEKKRNVLLSDDCYNLIMFWTLIVRNIINGNWMMSWDCNTSQSIFNAGMSFRYVAVVFFGADHYAFNHCSWVLFPSFYLLFSSLSLSLLLSSSSSCSSFFLFFATSLHVDYTFPHAYCRA